MSYLHYQLKAETSFLVIGEQYPRYYTLYPKYSFNCNAADNSNAFMNYDFLNKQFTENFPERKSYKLDPEYNEEINSTSYTSLFCTVIREENTTIGRVCFNLFLNNIYSEVMNYEYKTSYYMLISSDGRILVGSKEVRELVLGVNNNLMTSSIYDSKTKFKEIMEGVEADKPKIVILVDENQYEVRYSKDSSSAFILIGIYLLNEMSRKNAS